ncbi:MAG: hypothetical protein M3463_06520, partial [Verrucomicrobiota bacterium]|nr:hypothetical protein [Verrucomicrobiota bacterium]
MSAVLAATLFGLPWLAATASAEDKNGLRLTVTKKTLDRADGKPGYSREIDRTMALKATFKNISSKDLAEGAIHCVILIRRWGLSETGSVERYTKQLKLDPLKTAADVDLLVGEYHIGGHMHGSADYHVDQVAAWKITVDHAGRKTEFRSSSNFDSLDTR